MSGSSSASSTSQGESDWVAYLPLTFHVPTNSLRISKQRGGVPHLVVGGELILARLHLLLDPFLFDGSQAACVLLLEAQAFVDHTRAGDNQRVDDLRRRSALTVQGAVKRRRGRENRREPAVTVVSTLLWRRGAIRDRIELHPAMGVAFQPMVFTHWRNQQTKLSRVPAIADRRLISTTND